MVALNNIFIIIVMAIITILVIIIITIMVHKGLRDIISDGRDTVECGAAGSPRRYYPVILIITMVIIFNRGGKVIKMIILYCPYYS